VPFGLGVEIRVAGKIAIDEPLGDEHVHDGQRQRGIRARLDHEGHVSLFDGWHAVDVERHH
jgi:hypothetical protein